MVWADDGSLLALFVAIVHVQLYTRFLSWLTTLLDDDATRVITTVFIAASLAWLG